MKHLRSSLVELRRLFEQSISIKEIAEPLISFDSDHSSVEVQTFMKERGFDVIGVREYGITVGYAGVNDLTTGTLSNHKMDFTEFDICSDTDSIISVFSKLPSRDCLFIRTLGHIGGIVTRGDLQKIPVRMWIFGLISLLEMQMLRVIREKIDENIWKDRLNPNRLKKVKELYKLREKNNEEIDLVDCLQLADKATVISKDQVILSRINLDHKNAKEFIRDIVNLRNRVSHPQDIMAKDMSELAQVLKQVESVLRSLEAF